MRNNWLSRLIYQLVGEPPASPLPSSPSLSEVLANYQQSLNELTDDEQSLLTVLLVRDQVQAILQNAQTTTPVQVQQLLMLDDVLRQQTIGTPLTNLSKWRRSLQPPQSHWWWYLDTAVPEKEKDKDLVREIFAVPIFILTAALGIDIFTRLWVNAPDIITMLTLLLTLFIAAVPHMQRGRELIQWLLHRYVRLPTQHYAKLMIGLAISSCFLVASIRFFYLPSLAYIYNDQGVAAIQEGELATARQKLQQAIAINSELAPSYYNLADAYEAVGRYDEAIYWHQQALDYDLNFAPAYSNLGRLYLLQNEPDKAQTILLVGLEVLDKTNQQTSVADLQTVLLTHYRLLTHLGQAHYEQAQLSLATHRLEEAIILESDGELEAGFFSTRPHYYLALTYEKLERPPAAIIAQWEAALSYLNTDAPVDWEPTIRAHLEIWRQNEP